MLLEASVKFFFPLFFSFFFF
uniref:Uncharacterized protein n=1 Tax=Arundo donax TaxID=35708 RepID=A0A0A9AAM0_ARUDO